MLRKAFRTLKLVLALTLFAAGAGWFGDGVAALAPFVAGSYWPQGPWGAAALLVGGAIAVLLAGRVLYGARHQLVASRARPIPHLPATCRPVLIMGLSLPRDDAPMAEAEKAMARLTLDDLALSEAAHRDLVADLERQGTDPERLAALQALGLHPWRQTFRMIRHHVTGMGRRQVTVILMTSPQSQQLRGRFETLLRDRLAAAGLGDVLPQTPVVAPVDFEDYDAVFRAFETCVRWARLALDAHHGDLCIDITPGQKPFSVAGATMTVNCNAIFGYVTNEGALKFYDASITFASGAG